MPKIFSSLQLVCNVIFFLLKTDEIACNIVWKRPKIFFGLQLDCNGIFFLLKNLE